MTLADKIKAVEKLLDNSDDAEVYGIIAGLRAIEFFNDEDCAEYAYKYGIEYFKWAETPSEQVG